MSNNTVSVHDFAAAMLDMMQNYTEEVTEGVKRAVDTVAEEVNQEIKNNVTFTERTKKYLKSFKLKTSHEDRCNKRKTWYVGNGQHRLTHLLEKGHALQNGGRSQAFPHIQYGEELAKRRLEELAREAIENAGH
jgi:hypothetical protein